MFVGDSIQDVVAFLGWRDPTVAGGIQCEGTGFLLHYGGHGYLVTVRHVADKFDRDPFVVRINRHRGKALLLDADNVQWYYPSDKLIDLAITPADFGEPLYFPEKHIYSPREHGTIGIGDICYTAGLFHFIAGHTRNLPFLFTGHIALMPPPGEKIPVGNEAGGIDHVEGYLIENNAISGASGSPVFVRPSYRSTGLRKDEPDSGLLMGQDQIALLGVYQAAWFLPPDAARREAVKAKTSDVVPVGIGVVIPAQKLVDLLEIETLRQMRAKALKPKIVSAKP